MTTDSSIHDEVALLLPWFINGTLEPGQRTRVEEHLRSCIVCHRELAVERRTLTAFQQASTFEQSVQAGFERLRGSIAARAAAPSQSLSRPAGSLRTALRERVRDLGRASSFSAWVAASLAALAMGVLLTYTTQQPARVSGAPVSDGYRTLSNPAARVAGPDEIQVVFRRDASRAAIESVLQALPAKIVDGPDGAGVYTARLLAAPTDVEREAAISALRNQPQVIFAEAARPPLDANRSIAQPQ